MQSTSNGTYSPTIAQQRRKGNAPRPAKVGARDVQIRLGTLGHGGDDEGDGVVGGSPAPLIVLGAVTDHRDRLAEDGDLRCHRQIRKRRPTKERSPPALAVEG